MPRIERAAVAANAGFRSTGAIPALGVALALALASLAGCAQAPAAPDNTVARGGSAVADAGKTTSVLKTSTCARPEYPQDARRRGSQGTTTVRFLIDADGRVAQSGIAASSGDASLDEAARAALAKCRFKPALKDGKPHRAWVPVQYVWSMDPASEPQAPPATSATAF